MGVEGSPDFSDATGDYLDADSGIDYTADPTGSAADTEANADMLPGSEDQDSYPEDEYTDFTNIPNTVMLRSPVADENFTSRLSEGVAADVDALTGNAPAPIVIDSEKSTSPADLAERLNTGMPEKVIRAVQPSRRFPSDDAANYILLMTDHGGTLFKDGTLVPGQENTGLDDVASPSGAPTEADGDPQVSPTDDNR